MDLGSLNGRNTQVLNLKDAQGSSTSNRTLNACVIHFRSADSRLFSLQNFSLI